MNLGQIRTKCRSKLDEAAQKFWTDSELNDWINEGYRFYWQWLIKAQNPATITSTTLSIVSGTASIALPSDFILARLVERVLDNRTIPLKYFERYDTSNSTTSSFGSESYLPSYRFESSNIILEPTPQESIANGLKITYFKNVSDLTLDADIPAFSSLWHDLLVVFAVCRAKEKEEALGLGGTDLGVFTASLRDKETMFLQTIEISSIQRVYSQPFGFH